MLINYNKFITIIRIAQLFLIYGEYFDWCIFGSHHARSSVADVFKDRCFCRYVTTM